MTERELVDKAISMFPYSYVPIPTSLWARLWSARMALYSPDAMWRIPLTAIPYVPSAPLWSKR